MCGDVIDNRRLRLAERVRELLEEGATAACFVVGYLFLDGLLPLGNALERLTSVEILIGNVVNRLTEEQVREETGAHLRGGEDWVRPQEDVAASLREIYDRASVETALNLRRTIGDLPRTPEIRALLFTLARRIADGGLKVRLYTAGRIHAKLTLIDYEADKLNLAVVGSSNLTLGSAAAATEMNVVVREPQDVAALRSWYLALWESSQDFHRVLFDELAQSWALQAALSP